MSESTQPAEENPQVENVATIYDAALRNRLSFDYKHSDGLIYDIRPLYEPLSDDRYLQWLREFNLSGNENQVDESSREASAKLWDELVAEVGNIEYPEDTDWKGFFDNQSKVDMISRFLAVAIADSLETATGKLVFGATAENRVIVTECWVNDEIAQQRHELRPKSTELEKKFARILSKRFKQEKVGGLRRKPKIQYVPQDHLIAELYDDLKVSAEGFANDVIPMRFKTLVMDEYFASKVAEKKPATE